MKKKILFATCFFGYCLSIQSQVLYGTTFNGGTEGGGTINKFITATNTLIVEKSFEGLAYGPYYTNLIQASDGKLYGMTYFGGKNAVGTIFSYDPSSSVYKTLIDFNDSIGRHPNGSLMQASNGKLYGMTTGGGSKKNGVIFSFDIYSSTYRKLIDFEFDGRYPYGSLVQAIDGKLYGMTNNGGTGNAGVIFSFDISSSMYTKALDFGGSLGANPMGSLISAKDGKLYGMTNKGGTNNEGVIFSFDPLSSVYEKLKDFDEISGDSPYGSLLQAKDGKLYGVTSNGGNNDAGVIFSYDPSTFTYTKQNDFITGNNPICDLIQASDGKLFGMTYSGGDNGVGVIFSYEISSSSYVKLRDFDRINGSNPLGSLVQATNGKLYAMTHGLTEGGYGSVIFSFDPTTSVYTKLKDLAVSESGTNVPVSLIKANDGKLYGMTTNGGNSGLGVIFSYDAITSTYKKLKDLNYTTGCNPYSDLLKASNGKLYGTMTTGGTDSMGVIFSYDPSSSAYTKLFDFNNKIGSTPFGSLIQGKDGKLYGTTSSGGVNGLGVIFSYDPSSLDYKKLRDFDYTSGAFPAGGLVEVSNGKLYGLTNGGGSDYDGVIFSYEPSTATYTRLYDFSNLNDGSPGGNKLMLATDGKLYGITFDDGPGGAGVIFSYDPSTSVYTNLKYFFDSKEGTNPTGSLVQAADGKLYGETYYGGSVDKGVIFSFDPSSLTYKKLLDYNGANGANPYSGFYLIESKESFPKVSITIPKNNATYIAPANIQINATATDDDGTISKVEFYNGTTLLHTETVFPYGFKWANVHAGNYVITAKATDNSGLVTTSDPVSISVVPNKPPTVSITTPSNHQIIPGPISIHLEAAAQDADGKIVKVEFYNGSILIRTEQKFPYTYNWPGVREGSYILTAKATDNLGVVTTSAAVNITVVQNLPPTVSMVNPLNEESFSAPATISLLAAAQDPNNNLNKVSFYSGSTLIRSEFKFPYSYEWLDVPAGIYTITAVARDNNGRQTTSAPVTIHVSDPVMLLSNSSSLNNKHDINNIVSLKLIPNPVSSILNLHTSGLQQNEQLTISVISSLGIVMKMIRLNNFTERIQLNVSSLASGIYTVKMISKDKIIYRQFVKL